MSRDVAGMGQHLRKLRRERKATIRDVARALKVSEQTVSSWELGYRAMSVDRLIGYCRAIGAHIAIRLEDPS